MLRDFQSSVIKQVVPILTFLQGIGEKTRVNTRARLKKDSEFSVKAFPLRQAHIFLPRLSAALRGKSLARFIHFPIPVQLALKICISTTRRYQRRSAKYATDEEEIIRSKRTPDTGWSVITLLSRDSFSFFNKKDRGKIGVFLVEIDIIRFVLLFATRRIYEKSCVLLLQQIWNTSPYVFAKIIPVETAPLFCNLSRYPPYRFIRMTSAFR